MRALVVASVVASVVAGCTRAHEPLLATHGGAGAYAPPEQPTSDAAPRSSINVTGQAGQGSEERRAIAATLARVSAIRGIVPSGPVPGLRLTRGELVAKVRDKVLREYPAKALAREGQALQLLGFAPPGFDYLAETMKLLEAQLEGFYEPADGTMYLAGDIHGEQAAVTLAHELVHALQDQVWGLKEHSVYRPGKGDEMMAFACLAEGDATSAMLDFGMPPGRTALEIDQASIANMMRSGVDAGETKEVPHILKTTLVAPYVEGLAFVNARRREAGWPGVAEAWRSLPTTTEQILHPEKWAVHEPAEDVPPLTGAELGEGWQRDDDDSLGELGLAFTFAEWMDDAAAKAAANHWGGDRTAVYVRGDELALGIHVRYDDAPAGIRLSAAPAPAPVVPFAKGAWQSLERGLIQHLGRPTQRTAESVCFERPKLGPLLAMRRGRDVIITAGPARLRDGAWSFSSTCRRAASWGGEIAAQR